MSNEVATGNTNPLVQFKEQLGRRATELKMALPSHISEEKFQRTVITAVQQNPDLLGVSRQSLILACMKAAQDGLLPDGREAALVPFRNRKKISGQWQSIEEAAYIAMTFGIRKKVLQSRDAEGKPIVSALQVGVVYKAEVENGYFLWERGSDPEVQHRPMLDISAEEAADENIIAAYSIATMADGTRSCEVMRRFEIDKVRESSQTGATRNRDGSKREAKGPWVDWFAEMAKKTVLKRHSKSLPQSGDLIIEADDDESYAASSTVAVLASRSEDKPQLITDESGDTIDTSTGEVIDSTAENANEAEGPAKKERKPRAGAKANRDEGQAGNGSAAPAASTATTGDAAQSDASESSEDNDTRDELGVTKDPVEAKADEFLDRFGKAGNVIDLDRIHEEFEKASDGWPYEVVQAVEAGFKRHERRLAPSRAEPETVK